MTERFVLFDICANLTNKELKEERRHILTRASVDAGVAGVLICGANARDSAVAATLADELGVWCTAGLEN